MAITNPLKDAGLTVNADSPEFVTEVQKMLAPDAFAKASPLLPYSLVVVNNTGQYIWGFTVIYIYLDWISPAGTPWKHQISPSPGGPADHNSMLAPGAAFLITPVSGFLAAREPDGQVVLRPLLDEGTDRMIEQFKSQHASPSERIEVSVDSAIFEDGTLIGPDSEQMMQAINDRIRARKDLVDSLLNVRGEALRTKLLSHSQLAITNEYSRRKSGDAHSILSIFDSRGESAALDVVQGLRKQSWFSNSEFVRGKER